MMSKIFDKKFFGALLAALFISTIFAGSALAAPVSITAVASVNSATVTWLTNEPSTSELVYGLSPNAMTVSISDPVPVLAHSLKIPNLEASTTYYFHIKTENDNPLLYSSFKTLGAITVDIAYLQARIAELQAQLSVLLASQTQVAGSIVFKRDLEIGDEGSDVRALQQLLNADPRTAVAASGPGSKGQETTVYGPLTAAAVARFQSIYKSEVLTPAGIGSATGFLGSFTRKKLNALAQNVDLARSVDGGGAKLPEVRPSPTPTPGSSPAPSPVPTPSPSPTAKYAITASAAAGGVITPSGVISVASGESRSFIITPNSGYQVAGIIIDGVAVPTEHGYTFPNIISNHTISVTFSQVVSQAYTITASAGAGGSISPSGVVVAAAGTSKSFTITPNSGYQISGLVVDGVAVATATSYTFPNINANHTIAVAFSVLPATPTSYTITASSGSNGTVAPVGVVSVTAGTSKTFTITPNTGYKISTLAIDGVSAPIVSSYTFSNIIANHTISATFDLVPVAPTSYTITATAGNNGSINPPGTVLVSSGSSKTFTITPNTGYKISTLAIDGVSAPIVSSYTFSNIIANHTISATFDLIAVTPPSTKFSIGDRVQVSSGPLNVRATAGGALLGTQATGALGTVVAGPTANSDSGSFFFGSMSTAWWNINFDAGADGWSSEDFLTKYTAPTPPPTISYVIVASAGANGSISPSGSVLVTSGASQSFTITPNTGYKINTLVVDGVAVAAASPYTFTNVTVNHTISATFATVPVTTYTITSNSGSGGYVSPQGSLSTPQGATQIINIVPSSGYRIADVVIDGSSIVGSGQAPTSYTFTNVTANHSLCATFAATTVTPTPTPQPPTGSVIQLEFNGDISNSGGADIATAHFNPTFEVANSGTSQKAIRFNGVNSYVSLPSSATTNVGTGSFTLSAWVKPDELRGGRYNRIINKKDSKGFFFGIVDMGPSLPAHFRFNATDSNNVTVDFYQPTDLVVNQWALASVVVDRSSKKVRFFQNGKQVGGDWSISNMVGSLDNSARVGVGLFPEQEGAAAALYYKGAMAKVRMNKTALSSTEIQNRFNSEDSIFKSLTDIVYGGSTPYNDFMRANAETVFGFNNIAYANGDSDHADFNVGQISSGITKKYTGFGLQVSGATTGKATLANSSTAGAGLAGSNVGQLCLGSSYSGYEYIYGQATKPNAPWQGFYPAVRDGGEEQSTIYLPCISKIAIPATGHSSGEIGVGTTYLKTIAALPAAVGQYLLQNGTIFQAVSAIDAWSRNGKSSVSLLGQSADPYILGSSETEGRLMDMVGIANNMTIATTPPLARFTVTKYPTGSLVKGVNIYDDNRETMFATPTSVATTFRNLFTPSQTFELDASGSTAPPGATITEYNWSVRQGNPQNVTFTYLNAARSQVRVVIKWHEAEDVYSRYGSGIKSNMYVIALTTKSSTGVYSDQAVLTNYSMPNEHRTYDASGKLTEVAFDTSVSGPGTGASPGSEAVRFMTRMEMKNKYNYDSQGQLLGWSSYLLDDRFLADYDANGNKIIEKKPDGSVKSYQVPTYGVDSNGFLTTTFGPTQTLP